MTPNPPPKHILVCTERKSTPVLVSYGCVLGTRKKWKSTWG